ncbi:MAG: hypothetical protein Q8Q90_03860 [bacterium]|nr:hypothetical protein [bacterium]
MDQNRRNQVGYLAFRAMVIKKGLITLKDEPIDFEEMAKELGFGTSMEEARELYGTIAHELLGTMLGNPVSLTAPAKKK